MASEGFEQDLEQRSTAALPPPAWLPFAAAALRIFNRIADRFGMGFVVLLLLLALIGSFGSGQTKDDFIRYLLFSEVSGNQGTRLLIFFLILDSLIGITAGVRYFVGERKEMRRLAEEKSKWQERALQVELHHTHEHDIGGP